MRAKIPVRRLQPCPIQSAHHHLCPPPPTGKRAPAAWLHHRDAPRDKFPSPLPPRHFSSARAAPPAILYAPDRPPCPQVAPQGVVTAPREMQSQPRPSAQSSATRIPTNYEFPHSSRPALPQLDTARS